ncbi:glycine cleavage system protein H [candidate division KSB3 bacterium]|uniref:Glycine cleavage system H protein n=1 Tax=candidate division KSB3 bacterium TaxID=2044937 RepID=A0A2G6E6Y3_9BACT|nr:MAG: glycine cleavage system protein H [candidate division KSB3 bacterium]PIE30272.1 MAG: glycine cleavage system protein H [candidate division KSB3 bacterium]
MYPEDLKYTKEHEWVKIDGDLAVVGITSYAQEQLGDVVYVELPETGRHVSQFGTCGTIESVKTVSDLYSPLSGDVFAINEELNETPELLNNDPYGAGWILKITIQDQAELEKLLSADAYKASIRT